MEKWFRDNYRAFSVIFLLAVFIGWTAFLDNHGSDTVRISSGETRMAGSSGEDTYTAAYYAPGLSGAQGYAEEEKKDREKADTPMPTAEAAQISSPASESESAIQPAADSETAKQPVQGSETVTIPGQEQETEPVLEPSPTPEPSTAPSVTDTPAGNTSFRYVIANVKENLNVRSGPSESYPVIARLPANGYARIIERGSEWTKLKSGQFTGYANNRYLLFDKEAIERLKSLDSLYIKVTASVMNIRKGPGTDTDIIGKAYQGDRYSFIPEKSTDEWICIIYNQAEAYVSEQLVDEAFKLKTADLP